MALYDPDADDPCELVDPDAFFKGNAAATGTEDVLQLAFGKLGAEKQKAILQPKAAPRPPQVVTQQPAPQEQPGPCQQVPVAKPSPPLAAPDMPEQAVKAVAQAGQQSCAAPGGG